MTHMIDEWTGCYPSNWKGVIVPEAMAHPAKYSSKLIRRIYDHIAKEGWVKKGDRVVDPFGGVALGALDAMRLGLNWYGNELEEKFFQLGNANIDNWLAKFPHLSGSAHLSHGDSRKLIEVLGSQFASVALSSPPYADSDQDYKGGWKRFHDGHEPLFRNDIQREAQYGASTGQLSAMKATGFEAAISSPPFLQSQGGIGKTAIPSKYANDPTFMARHAAGNKAANGYGESDGQLSSMRDGSFEAAISSPPFGEQQTGQGIAAAMRGESDYSLPNNHTGKHGYQDQAEAIGNLAGMSMDGFDVAISSPPYEGEVVRARSSHLEAGRTAAKGMTRAPGMTAGVLAQEKYGDATGQLGNDSGNDFWLAARTIVEQVYLSLVPGGHAVWVLKDYAKSKRVVPFCDQWRQLCESVGFVTLHEHHAMLVRHKGAQHGFDGSLTEYKTESKSFFRRLAEKKGSPRIDWETVLCMVKQ